MLGGRLMNMSHGLTAGVGSGVVLRARFAAALSGGGPFGLARGLSAWRGAVRGTIPSMAGGALLSRPRRPLAVALRNGTRVYGGVLGVVERVRVVHGLGEARRFGRPHKPLSGPVRLIVLVRLSIGHPAGIALVRCGPARLVGVDGLALAIPARS